MWFTEKSSIDANINTEMKWNVKVKKKNHIDVKFKNFNKIRIWYIGNKTVIAHTNLSLSIWIFILLFGGVFFYCCPFEVTHRETHEY